MKTKRYVWQPTTDEIAERFGIDRDRVVRFDQNTSPDPTEWAAPFVPPVLPNLNEYPAASYRPLRESAGRYTGVDPEQVVPGAGVDELIILAARAFLSAGGRARGYTPTYPLYQIATEQQGASFEGLSRPSPESGHGADLTWICVPNNPTGDRMPDVTIERTIETSPGIVVLDAAYAEFTNDRWGEWIGRYDHLLVLHTLSKGFGLAGIRVGYAIGNPALIDAIDRVRPPGSISTVSNTLAIAALSDPDRMRRSVDRLIAERERLRDRLGELGFQVPPSEANFLLVHVGQDAHTLATGLMREGLVVREFAHIPELIDHLRFTVRSGTDNDRLINAIERIRS
ncbi:MAG: aminotransferase class I/II-fold pyridoxal phosphate-dependent enzyme [Acidimicrobiia bacterium]